MSTYVTVWSELKIPRAFAEKMEFDSIEIFRNFDKCKGGSKNSRNSYNPCFGGQSYLASQKLEPNFVVFRAQRLHLRISNDFSRWDDLDFPYICSWVKHSKGGEPVISDEEFNIVLKMLEETLPVQIFRHEEDPRQCIVFHNSDDVGGIYSTSLWLQSLVRHLTETADVLPHMMTHVNKILTEKKVPDLLSSYLHGCVNPQQEKFGDHASHFGSGHGIIKYKHEAEKYIESYDSNFPVSREEISNYMKWWVDQPKINLSLFEGRTSVSDKHGVQNFNSVLLHHLIRNRAVFNQTFGG